MPSIEHLIRFRPTTVQNLLRFTPQVPATCPQQFLDLVIRTISQTAETYGLDTNRFSQDNQRKSIPLFESVLVKEEECLWDDPNTPVSDQEDATSSLNHTGQELAAASNLSHDATAYNPVDKKAVLSRLDCCEPRSPSQTEKPLCTHTANNTSFLDAESYDLSPSDVAEFDQLVFPSPSLS